MTRAKWAEEWFNDEDKLKRVHRCVENSLLDNVERVRIAILDSGIDKMHSEMVDNMVLDSSSHSVKDSNVKRRIKAWKGFPDSFDPLRDRVGHGTHCASVILRTAPFSSLYIGRIFDDRGKIKDYDEIVKVTCQYCVSCT